MGKNLVAIFALTLCLSVTSCSAKEASVATPDETESIKTTPQIVTPEEKPVDKDELPDGVFRKVNFGMTKQEVRDCEEFALEEEGGLLATDNVTIAGVESVLLYEFNDDDVLQTICVSNVEDHYTENEYITDYENYKEALTDKYGNPSEDDTIWLDDLYQDDPSSKGMAVITGDLIYTASWEKKDFEVRCILSGSDFDATCGILIQSTMLTGRTEDSGM